MLKKIILSCIYFLPLVVQAQSSFDSLEKIYHAQYVFEQREKGDSFKFIKEELWKIRKNISPAVNAYTLTKSDDVVVPRANLPKLIKGIKAIGKEFGFNTVCFGHLGDGNLHVNILKEDISEADWETKIPLGIGEIFKLTVSLGGTLSGEHGVGIAKRPYMAIAMSEVNLELMRGIKKVFDPKGILNPGKIF